MDLQSIPNDSPKTLDFGMQSVVLGSLEVQVSGPPNDRTSQPKEET